MQDDVDVANLHFLIDLELAHPADDDRLRMDKLFGLAELFDVFANSLFVNEGFFPVRLGAFIGQMNFQTFIEKRQFAQSIRKDIELEFRRDRKYFGIRQKCDEGAGMLFVLDFTNDFELCEWFCRGKTRSDRL